MKRKHRISLFVAILIIALAAVGDIAQFFLTGTVLLLLLSLFVTFLVSIALWLWFALLGVKFMGKGANKKLASMFATTVAELIPVIDALPGLTLGAATTIIFDRIEEAKEWAEEDKKLAAQNAEPARPRVSFRTRIAPSPAASHQPSETKAAA